MPLGLRKKRRVSERVTDQGTINYQYLFISYPSSLVSLFKTFRPFVLSLSVAFSFKSGTGIGWQRQYPQDILVDEPPLVGYVLGGSSKTQLSHLVG